MPIPPLVVSADEHLVEPPEFWSDLLPAALAPADRDRAPRLDGAMLVVDGQVVPTFRLFPDLAARSDTRPGAGDAAGRLAVMDGEGVDVALLFPQRAMGMFALRDDRLAIDCITAYNEWLASLCASARGRLVGVAVLATLRQPDATADYLEHLGSLGFTTVMLPCWPRGPGYADERYRPMWEALQDSGMLLAFHTSETPDDNGPGGLGTYLAVQMQPFRKLWAHLVFTGLLDRYPGLRILFAEGGISWVPSALDDADRIARVFAADLNPVLAHEPSAYWHRQCWATYIDDPSGLDQLGRIGADRVLWSTDYPHPEGTFGTSRAAVAELQRRLDPAAASGVTGANAVGLLGLRLPS